MKAFIQKKILVSLLLASPWTHATARLTRSHRNLKDKETTKHIGRVTVGLFGVSNETSSTATSTTLQNTSRSYSFMTIATSNITMVGNDVDKFGCLKSAGYSYCNWTDSCIRPWEINCTSKSVTTSSSSYSSKSASISFSNISIKAGTWIGFGVKQDGEETASPTITASPVSAPTTAAPTITSSPVSAPTTAAPTITSSPVTKKSESKAPMKPPFKKCKKPTLKTKKGLPVLISVPTVTKAKTKKGLSVLISVPTVTKAKTKKGLPVLISVPTVTKANPKGKSMVPDWNSPTFGAPVWKGDKSQAPTMTASPIPSSKK